MLAYTNTELTKDQVIARVTAHRAADRLVFGTGWESGQGCAVGCTLETYDHKLYPAKIGVPVELAYLEDAIFEGFGRTGQTERGLAWPTDFLRAIPVGADLSMVWPKWATWMLAGLNDRGRADVRKAIDGVAWLFREWIDTGTRPAQDRFDAAAYAADDAADAAADVAYAAANAAYAAANVAYAAAYAALAAAYAAFWRDAADKLLELLASAPAGEAGR